MSTGDIRYTLTSDGVNIAYTTVGGGFPLVRVTGWVSHLENLLQVVPGYDGFQNVLFDKRGTGLSDRGLDDYSVETRLKDLEAVVKAAALDRFVLHGVSEGGPIAILYAAKHPERVAGLVLYGTYASGDTVPPDTHKAILALAKADWGLASVTFTQMFAPGASTDEAMAAAESQRASATAEDAVKLWQALTEIDVTSALGGIACPTAVIHVRGDGVIPFERARQLAASIPGAKLVPIDGERHFLGPVERPQVEAAVSEFLGQVLQREGTAPGRHSVTGFRTILFTDVVASTPLLAQLKDEKMREVMRDHDEVLEAAVVEHGGRVIKTIGDAFMAEFAVPSGAVEAAIAAQRGIRDKFGDSDVPIRLRIGINAGEPIEEDGDLHGASVVVAKRLESEAGAGGILVSDVLRQAVAGKSFEFTDRGDVVLKGFDEPVRAWAVKWE